MMSDVHPRLKEDPHWFMWQKRWNRAWLEAGKHERATEHGVETRLGPNVKFTRARILVGVRVGFELGDLFADSAEVSGLCAGLAVLRGQVEITAGGRQITAKAGDVALVEPSATRLTTQGNCVLAGMIMDLSVPRKAGGSAPGEWARMREAASSEQIHILSNY